VALQSIGGKSDPPVPNRRPGSAAEVRGLVVVDEAWRMLRDGAAANWMFKMAKAARKRHAGLAVIPQDAADVLGSELGQAVVANAATQVLMRQAPQAIDADAEAVAPNAAERQLHLQERPGV